MHLKKTDEKILHSAFLTGGGGHCSYLGNAHMETTDFKKGLPLVHRNWNTMKQLYLLMIVYIICQTLKKIASLNYGKLNHMPFVLHIFLFPFW